MLKTELTDVISVLFTDRIAEYYKDLLHTQVLLQTGNHRINVTQHVTSVKFAVKEPLMSSTALKVFYRIVSNVKAQK